MTSEVQRAEFLDSFVYNFEAVGPRPSKEVVEGGGIWVAPRRGGGLDQSRHKM